MSERGACGQIDANKMTIDVATREKLQIRAFVSPVTEQMWHILKHISL